MGNILNWIRLHKPVPDSDRLSVQKWGGAIEPTIYEVQSSNNTEYLHWASGYKYFHHPHILMTGASLMLTAGLAPPDLHNMKNWVPLNTIVKSFCIQNSYLVWFYILTRWQDTSDIVSGSMWRLVLEGPRLTSIWTSPVKKDSDWSWEAVLTVSLGARHSTLFPDIVKNNNFCVVCHLRCSWTYPKNVCWH